MDQDTYVKQCMLGILDIELELRRINKEISVAQVQRMLRVGYGKVR